MSAVNANMQRAALNARNEGLIDDKSVAFTALIWIYLPLKKVTQHGSKWLQSV